MEKQKNKLFAGIKAEDCSDSLWFFLIFALSFLMRIFASCSSFAPIYPDEIFQTVEMAHKLAFGKGITYWEFEVGARSWFFPGVLAAVYKILDFCGIRDVLFLNVGIKIFLSLFHALSVSTLYLIFRSWSFNKFTAFLFSLPIATSYLLSYISVRTLTESAALPFMVFALYQATKYVENYKPRHLLFTILFCGIAYMLRFQTAVFSFGIALVFLATSKKRIKTSLIFGFGFIGMMLLQGLLDWFTWGEFMRSLVAYVDYNVFRGVANRHGVFPYYFYLANIVKTFHPITYTSAILLMIFSFVSFDNFKKTALFFFPFLFFFVVHSAIPHKEPRFVFACFFALLALSSAFFAYLYFYLSRRKKAVLFLSLALLFSLDAFPHLTYKRLWNSSISHDLGREEVFAGVLEAGVELGKIETLKRAYFLGIPQIWSGGYAYFHKDVPLFYADDVSKAESFFREAYDSAWEGCYFAVYKNFVLEKTKFKEFLHEVKSLPNFKIYRLETADRLKQIAFSDLPKFTKNGSKWNSKENIIMSESGVEILMQAPVFTNKIQIALDSSDSYRLTFLNRRNVVGEIVILPKKEKRGMFVYSKKLPDEVSEKGFDLIKVVPLENDKARSLGSVNFSK